MEITQTVSEIIQSTPQAGATVGAAAARLFTDVKMGDVIHIVNNHATQEIFIKWVNHGETPTITSTNYYEKLAALGGSVQLSFKTPNKLNLAKTIDVWLLGSGAGTTYNAVQMR